jgi:biotin operon repressor
MGDGEGGGSGDEKLEKTEMIMRRWGILQGKEDNLVKDLKETTLSFKKLGKKYGVSRQAIHIFYKRQGIKRPVKPRGHQTGGCRLCQKLIQISKKPHSEFISIHTIVKKMGGSMAEYRYHLRTLRDRGLVDEKFGRLHSKRAEEAYAIYFKKRLPIRTVGLKVGIKNFQSVIRKHRELGWNVPPSLYVYGGRKRSRIQSEIQRRKKR